MRLELEAAEQKLEDLEEEIIRLDQEEQILCAEVQESTDPPSQEGDEGEDPEPSPAPGDTPMETSAPGDFKGLLQQLQAMLQRAGQPRKKARSGPTKDEEDNAAMDYPPEWGSAP